MRHFPHPQQHPARSAQPAPGRQTSCRRRRRACRSCRGARSGPRWTLRCSAQGSRGPVRQRPSCTRTGKKRSSKWLQWLFCKWEKFGEEVHRTHFSRETAVKATNLDSCFQANVDSKSAFNQPFFSFISSFRFPRKCLSGCSGFPGNAKTPQAVLGAFQQLVRPEVSGSVTSFRMSHEIVPVQPAEMSHHIVPVGTSAAGIAPETRKTVSRDIVPP